MKIPIVRSLDPQAYCMMKVIKVEGHEFVQKIEENVLKKLNKKQSNKSQISE